MDHYTEYKLALTDAARQERAAMLLVKEAAATFEEAHRRQREGLREGFSWRTALAASADNRMFDAPAAVARNERIAAEWNITTRVPNSILLDEPLTRTMVTSTPSAGGYLVEAANERPAAAAGDTVGKIFGLMSVATAQGAAGNQMVGRFETLPTVSVLSSETTNITEQSPPTTQSILSPHHLASWSRHSRQLALQSETGAEALARLHINAVRSKALQQILEGTGSGGQIEGLTVNAAVPTAAGTSVDMAKVCTAIESVEQYGTGPFAWVVSAAAAKLLRQRAVISGGAGILADNRIAGYPVYVTGCTTSAIAVFGSWKDLQVFQWRPIEVASDPYTNFQAQLIGLRAWLTVDAAPMLPKSFYTLTAIT